MRVGQDNGADANNVVEPRCHSHTAADLVNELPPELVVLKQHLVPQVTVHALNNVPSLDLEQTADTPQAIHV